MSKRAGRFIADLYDTQPLSARPVTVRVINHHSGAVLVEWLDNELGQLRRATLPERDVRLSADGRTAETRNPDEGVPYGDPLEEMFGFIDTTPETLAREFRKQGLWTVKDIETRPADVAAALSTVIGMDVSSLIDRARLWQRDQSRKE